MNYHDPLRCPSCDAMIPMVSSVRCICFSCGQTLRATLALWPAEVAVFAVRLYGFGQGKISTIKGVRALTNLGLAEAKNLVEGPMPVEVRVSVQAAVASALADFDTAGAQYEVIREEPFATQTATAAPVARDERLARSVTLLDGGRNKIEVIKLIREVSNLGLRESKDLCDGAPSRFFVAVTISVGEVQRRFVEAGASVSVDPA